MPKFPDFSWRPAEIPGSVFETYRATMQAHGEKLVRLHIGDTYLPPEYPLPLDPEFTKAHPDFNRYCDTFGVEALREALADKLREDNALDVRPEQILVTNGTTSGLSVSVSTLVDPGEEVLVLTPAWPFFFGMVRVAGGRILEAPLYSRLFDEPDLDIVGYLERLVTPNTVALYLNTPNNPSGKVLTRAQVQQIAEVARKHRLWVISDEAYDGLTFDDRPHVSIASLPQIFEQTVSLFTFSKSFMFAGLRLGFAVGTREAIERLNKIMVHQIYSPATVAQQMMVEPVKNRHMWLPEVRKHYQVLRDLFVERLEIAFPEPEGTYFIFFPADRYLNGRDYRALVDACLNAAVSVAPGHSFGKDFGTYIRLCFTGEPAERLVQGIARLNRIFNG